MTNFLTETRFELVENAKEPQHIAFIGSAYGHYSCTWDEFEKLADFEYYKGFGAQKIATDLVIVFTDGSWLSRREYDGAEAWRYNKCPQKNPETFPISRFNATDKQVGWVTLHEIHNPEY